jgi:hypothetical protein
MVYLKVNKGNLRYLRQQKDRIIPDGVSREECTHAQKNRNKNCNFSSAHLNLNVFLGAAVPS